jgi:hypothetical protein
MDRLRQIAIENKKGVTPLEVKYARATGGHNEKLYGSRLQRSIQGDPRRLSPTITLRGAMQPVLLGASAVGTAASGIARGLNNTMGMDYAMEKKVESLIKHVPPEQWDDEDKMAVALYQAQVREKQTGFTPEARQSGSVRRGTDEPIQYSPVFANGL